MSDVEAVQTNLSTCLKGSAQIWYTEGLSDLKKKALRTLEDGADHWCNALLKKFKKFVASALNYLTTERYILNDVRANRDISSFVFQVMRHVKAANIADLHDQLIWAYNAIVSELTKDIDSFDENISIMTFLKNLKTKKNIWHRIYIRKSTSSRIGPEFSSYQVNSSNLSYFAYDQSTYISRQSSQRQFQTSFGNVNAQRNFRLSLNDNVFQKGKASYRLTEIITGRNIQSTNDDQSSTQSGGFGIQSVRNQIISAWRQNAPQGIISEQNQTHLSTNSADTIFTGNRTSLGQYNNEERRQYQDSQGKRGQFRKFYDNREQLMKAYVREEQNQRSDENEENIYEQKESFEDIDSVEKNDRNDDDDQFVYILSIDTSDICKKCDKKREIFKSNNVFHSHIRDCTSDEVKINITLKQHDDLPVIKSRAKDTVHKEYDFRFYQYVIAWMFIALDKSFIEGVIDIECAMSLLNIKYLIVILSTVTIMKMPVLINVRGIDNALHQSSSYVMLDLYLDGIFHENKARGHIRREFHLIDGLKCRILMRLDIMISEKMIINLVDKSFVISTCENLVILIRINSKLNSRIRRIVHSKKSVVISSNSVVSISTYLRGKKLFLNRDFLFELNNNALTESLSDLGGFYTHVCDCNLTFVHVRNALVNSVTISSKTRLRLLTEYEKEECFQVETELHEWVVVCNEAEAESDFS
jgi:hypothetical protein